MTPATREKIQTLKDLHARLTEPVDWPTEAEHLLAAARHFQGLTRRQFEAELSALRYPEDDAGMASALAETARRGPRRLAAEYRRRAEDAASGRSARMLADLAAEVWAQIVELEAGGTGTPIKRRLGR
jgi:hypothetical protein